MGKIHTVKEVTEILKLTDLDIYKMIKNNTLKCCIINNRIFIKDKEIKKLLKGA